MVERTRRNIARKAMHLWNEIRHYYCEEERVSILKDILGNCAIEAAIWSPSDKKLYSFFKSVAGLRQINQVYEETMKYGATSLGPQSVESIEKRVAAGMQRLNDISGVEYGARD